MERFWSKVDKSGDCWAWVAAKNSKGYGIFRYQDSTRLAHRISYELTSGAIPGGVELDHMCWNRDCVRPEHLRPVLHSQNTQNRSGSRSDSKSGIRGVHRHTSGRWQAQASYQGKNVYLGLFDSPQDAEAAVTAWRRVNMPYSLTDQKKG